MFWFKKEKILDLEYGIRFISIILIILKFGLKKLYLCGKTELDYQYS